jgi:Zn-dependent metalloprotease
MKQINLKTHLDKAWVLLLLLALQLNVNAQVRLRYDAVNAQTELETINRQKEGQRKQKLKSGLVVPEFNIHKRGEKITIEFSAESKFKANKFFETFSKELGIGSDYNFVFLKTSSGKNGYLHHRYQEYYKGIKVKDGKLVIHEQNGSIRFVTGNLFNGFSLDPVPSISKTQAIEKAIGFVKAERYFWENKETEAMLKKEKNNKKASYYPDPELIIASKNEKAEKPEMALAYTMVIRAEKPYKKTSFVIDASTGEVLYQYDILKHSDDPASTATLAYATGTKTITSDRTNLIQYRLNETGRPIITQNMMNETNKTKAVQFTNYNNRWEKAATNFQHITIKAITNNWRDFEDNGNLPDLYIEIRDFTNTVIYSTKDRVKRNATLPCEISLNNITLLNKNLYSVWVYDEDAFSANDLVGLFSYSNANLNQDITFLRATINMAGRTVVSGALDAHWGLEKIYDYYANPLKHNWKSYDARNSQIKIFVHGNTGSNNQENAEWDPDAKDITFYDGDGINTGNFTALDICAHEFTHGVNQHGNSGGFSSSGESFSLDESFCDIMASVIEFNVKGGAANWTIAEDLFINPVYPLPTRPFIRSLKEPKDRMFIDEDGDNVLESADPNTYKGLYWVDIATPNGDLHKNAGVQNKWFYLLCEGGSSHIDQNPTLPVYEVPAIGMTVAESIVWENMMEILESNATYTDSYFGALKATESLGFVNPNPVYKAVREAWFAVGVAPRPVINNFTPTEGPEGTTVSINGSGFSGISYVGFNDTWVAAPNFTVNGDFTQILIDVPLGATTGPISIVAGYDTVKTTDVFTIGCEDDLTVTVESTDASSFFATVTGGIPPYSYSLDNQNFQASNVFNFLQSGTTYTVYVKDAGACEGSVVFFLSNAIECNVQSGSGGQGTSFITQNLGNSAGFVEVNYQMYTIPDQMEIYYDGELMASTSGLVSGSGVLTFNYDPNPGGPYHCIIRMYAPNSGTAWDFIAYCPTALRNGKQEPISKNTVNENGITVPKGMVLYPNPTASTATLQLTGIKNMVQVTLTDITGKELWKQTNARNGTIQLPVDRFLSGIYLVTVYFENGEKRTWKLIKTN